MKGRKAHLTDLQKDSFGIIYYNTKNSVEVCESLMQDKSLDTYLRYNIIRMWELNLSKIKSVLDKGLGVNESFDEQIKNTDTLGLNEIIKDYIGMSPTQREAVEEMFKAIRSNEDIEVELR